jgi:hypothetical protein
MHASGVTALVDPELEHAALIISDWTNRPLSGRDLYDALQKRGGTMPPVIFLSPWADEIDAMYREADIKPAGLIPVPYILRKALECVNRVLCRQPPDGVSP